jgi:hypothetical protein
MPDPIRLITKRITEMTYQIVDGKAQFIWGTVLGRNPDGTVNINDGKGGCVLVAPPMNARTGDRVMVNLGAMVEGIGMPGVSTYMTNVPQVNHGPTAQIVDNLGNIYSETTGAATGTGGEMADPDPAFGYYHYVDPWPFPITHYLLWAGAAGSNYHETQIGSIDMTSGFQGESYSANNTVLCAGLGVSSTKYCGAEHALAGGDNDTRWSINIRDATFGLLASNAADYIHNWITDHPNTFVGTDEDFDVHISPDPQDGSFWVNLVGGPGWGDPPDPAPMFNVSPEDGSLIKTISLVVTAGAFRRVHRVLVS